MLGGWTLLVAADGGQDFGDGAALTPAGTTAAFLALALGAPAALAALWLARDQATLRTSPTRLALAAMAALAALTGLSILWSPTPDLSWIEANHAAIVLVALVLGVALGARVRGAPARLAAGISLAAVPPVAWALATKVAPAWLSEDGVPARLSEPLTYPNALALVAVLAVPGALWAATLSAPAHASRVGLRSLARPLAAAWLAALGVTILLTYSRGGLVAMAVAVGIALAALPSRRLGALTGLAAGVIGAAWPAAHGLSAAALSTDGLAAADRVDAGIGLGWRLAVGMALAAGLALAATRLRAPTGARRWAPRATSRRALAVIGVAAAVLVGGAGLALAADDGLRGWADERLGTLVGGSEGAVGNEAGRLTSVGDNQRLRWWGEALGSFTDAPLVGEGAGSFRVARLAHREDGNEAFSSTDPHSVAMGMLSGLGLAGALALLAAAAGVGWAAVRARRAGVRAGLALALLVPVAVQALVDRTWTIPAVIIPAALAAGVVLAVAAPGRAQRPRPVGAPLAAGAVALAGLAVVSALAPWWSARAVAAGDDALVRGDFAAAFAHAADARTRNPLALAPILLQAQTNGAVGDTERAIGSYRDATEVQPDNPETWALLALALERAGQLERSAAAWRQVIRLDPMDARARFALDALSRPVMPAPPPAEPTPEAAPEPTP